MNGRTPRARPITVKTCCAWMADFCYQAPPDAPDIDARGDGLDFGSLQRLRRSAKVSLTSWNYFAKNQRRVFY